MAKIMVVDDEEHIVMILRDSLEFSGFEVTTACDGAEALEKIPLVIPDLVILDVGMPRVDGWEVCRRLKANPQTRSIPIIILTAYAQQSDRQKGLALGASRFISKPCDPTLLIEEVNALLNRKITEAA